jgi:hypothetical protein
MTTASTKTVKLPMNWLGANAVSTNRLAAAAPTSV